MESGSLDLGAGSLGAGSEDTSAEAPTDATRVGGRLVVGDHQPAQRDAVVQLLARAFRDSPLNRAVIGRDRDRRLRCNLHGMRAHLPPAEAGGSLLRADLGGRVAGALVSAQPFHWPFPSPSLPARLRCLVGQGVRVAGRWARVAEALHREHRLGPHWYLGTLGVDPDLQGQGVGTALLRDWLRQVDADGRPAYLETDAERNLPFYERAGFRVMREVRILEVPVWLMDRPARE